MASLENRHVVESFFREAMLHEIVVAGLDEKIARLLELRVDVDYELAHDSLRVIAGVRGVIDTKMFNVGVRISSIELESGPKSPIFTEYAKMMAGGIIYNSEIGLKELKNTVSFLQLAHLKMGRRLKNSVEKVAPSESGRGDFIICFKNGHEVEATFEELDTDELLAKCIMVYDLPPRQR